MLARSVDDTFNCISVDSDTARAGPCSLVCLSARSLLLHASLRSLPAPTPAAAIARARRPKRKPQAFKSHMRLSSRPRWR